jgi:hypothetical protein
MRLRTLRLAAVLRAARQLRQVAIVLLHLQAVRLLHWAAQEYKQLLLQAYCNNLPHKPIAVVAP